MTTTNKKIVSIIGIVMVLITVLCCTLVGCSSSQESVVSPSKESKDISVEVINSEYVMLSAGVAYAAADTGFPTQELTAVITPDSAKDKTVSWSVVWATPESSFASGKNVTDYITVVPETEGGLKAVVTCKSAFGSDKINVVVTTNDGGYTATCVVSFMGIPTSMSTSTSLTNAGDVYYAVPSKANSVSINLANVFNSVGASYNNFTYSVSSVGTFFVGVMDDWGGVSYHGQHALSDLQSRFLADGAISISGSTLTLTPGNIYSFASGDRQYFVSDGEYDDFGWATFGGYNADSYFLVEITQPTTGLSCSFKFQIDKPGVSKVTVYKTELVF